MNLTSDRVDAEEDIFGVDTHQFRRVRALDGVLQIAVDVCIGMEEASYVDEVLRSDDELALLVSPQLFFGHAPKIVSLSPHERNVCSQIVGSRQKLMVH